MRRGWRRVSQENDTDTVLTSHRNIEVGPHKHSTCAPESQCHHVVIADAPSSGRSIWPGMKERVSPSPSPMPSRLQLSPPCNLSPPQAPANPADFSRPKLTSFVPCRHQGEAFRLLVHKVIRTKVSRVRSTHLCPGRSDREAIETYSPDMSV
jgi:hypothetical protein